MPPWSERAPLFNKRLSSLRKEELQRLAAHLGLDEGGTVAVLKARVRQKLLSDIKFYMDHPDFRALFTRHELADIIEGASSSSGSPFHGISLEAEAAPDGDRPHEEEDDESGQEGIGQDAGLEGEEPDEDGEARTPPPSDDMGESSLLDHWWLIPPDSAYVPDAVWPGGPQPSPAPGEATIQQRFGDMARIGKPTTEASPPEADTRSVTLRAAPFPPHLTRKEEKA
ncbi:hypothetical protein PUNSTDRAFT_129102 [Punctularia strigosozonata HHB-11173 SS5]|uniref:uncharacterized protein n=1 Tax=Punctularia strigosozonata (strain HHB-11173) TaxID=741275 RepID=UPI0004416EEE|nr:uncharacterized protein PUNSTDRAFT_129102 [Punctularia strigosozonata HHB-11173 SS5]EIN13417.1 hypothetical protein PUNSTDRAFT_129102 [Punctularia strigosozonata HHB-11173 SS5]